MLWAITQQGITMSHQAITALIIDDEPDICELISLSLENMQIHTLIAHSYQQAIHLLNQYPVHFCLTDMRLPDGNGLDIISYTQQHYPELPICMVTAHGTIETAILALKQGAFDFICKPIDTQGLKKLVNAALKTSAQPPKKLAALNQLLGNSAPMQELRHQIQKVAKSQAPIYISGPSGAGKELVARTIHQLSARQDEAFVPVNCGAIPPELMESEFFGYRKGSFTGAQQDKIGLFQAAHHGTLFLDEVADLSLAIQVKLLRAIQEKAIRLLGSNQEQRVDVRILCATHQDLTQCVAQQTFRQDLFYRLNVIELKVPSLSARRQDIPLLTQHILQKIAQQTEQKVSYLTDAAYQVLQQYSFPGNIRELENILERSVTLCDKLEIDVKALKLPKEPPLTAPPLAQEESLENYLQDIEKNAIEKALSTTQDNQTQAAKLLGLSLRTLRYRLKKLNLMP
jgi:two-component system response regulator PilR (NtrC family)